jgi:hypothetical protein
VSRGAGFVGEAGLGREPLVIHRAIAAGDKAALLLSSGVSAALADPEIADLARVGPLPALKVTSSALCYGVVFLIAYRCATPPFCVAPRGVWWCCPCPWEALSPTCLSALTRDGLRSGTSTVVYSTDNTHRR